MSQTVIAWSAKVSPDFVTKVKEIVSMLRMPESGASDLMSCMAWESGESFSPSIPNGAGSGAVGLIQFMPLTALSFFYDTSVVAQMSPATKKAKGIECCKKLAAMTAVEQLDYVYKYFKPYAGRLENLGDLYMAILWPRGIGHTDDYVLWEKGNAPTTYRQNIGLDVNKDGAITRGECLVKIKQKLAKGLRPENIRA